MTARAKYLLAELGLDRHGGFYRDKLFVLAVLAGFVVVFAIRFLFPGVVVAPHSLSGLVLFNSLVWFPVLEELLFRGFVQGQLSKRQTSTRKKLGLSYSNWLTSILFVAMHFVHHPPLWAMSVLAPSLVFGLMRDRYRSVWPAIALHSIYNAQYLLVLG